MAAMEVNIILMQGQARGGPQGPLVRRTGHCMPEAGAGGPVAMALVMEPEVPEAEVQVGPGSVMEEMHQPILEAEEEGPEGQATIPRIPQEEMVVQG